MLRSGQSSTAGAESLIRHLHILRTVTAAVSRSLNLNEVLQKSVNALTHVTGHEIASLHLIADDGHTLLLSGDRGLSERLREVNLNLRLGQGLIGRVALTGRAERLDEVTKSPDLLPLAQQIVAADGIRGFVCVPIRARHRILGTLSLGRRSERPFTDEEVVLLECTADQIGLALDNARLYSETRHQLDDLRRTQTEVVKAERLAAVGELAGGVAHEINNPLMIILGQVHLLLQSQDSADMLSGLKAIDGATKRAASIVRDLVLAEHFRCVRPGAMWRTRSSILEQQRGQLEARHVVVRTGLAETPDIWADAGQLQEVFFHLIQNAEHAMVAAHGGGTLTIRVVPSQFGVRVEMADDGPGLRTDDLPRIFNPFFTTKAPGEGRGLGLSVAHSIVSEHEGRLWAENRPEGGAIFVVELPVGTAPGTDAALGAPLPGRTSGRS
jgi:signal transduction histidine kinase